MRAENYKNRHLFNLGRRGFLTLAARGLCLSPFINVFGRPSFGGAGVTGFCYDPVYLDHNMGAGHPESPARLSAILQKFSETGLDGDLVPITPLSNPDPYIMAVHNNAHIAGVDSLAVTGAVANRAVGGALAAVKAVCEGTVNNAFCALRPPGHHANNHGGNYDGPGAGEGFCFYNNAAIAARYAQVAFGLKKVAIIDWDYHHGNGTQNAFYTDPSILFFSTHHWQAYPGTGDPALTGSGDGTGFNINAPLAPGATDSDIKTVWDNKLLKPLDDFKPDLIIISAGFDSRINDTLGTFAITDRGFAELTATVLGLAASHCQGRVVSLLEGGYNIEGLASAAAAHVGKLLEGHSLNTSINTNSAGGPYVVNGSLALPGGLINYPHAVVHSSTGRRLFALTGLSPATRGVNLGSKLTPGIYILKWRLPGRPQASLKFRL